MATELELLDQYEAKIKKAVADLGPAKPGHVWLYRAEHLRDVPPEEINTSNYTPEQIETLNDAKGRWFGYDLAERFVHLYNYTTREPHEGVDKLRISALQVPLDVAAACHLDGVPAPEGDWQTMTPLQRGRFTSTSPENEFFFPKNLTPTDLPGADKHTIDRMQSCNKVLADLEAHKQPLCEIDLADYKAANPEAWYNMARKLDKALGTSQTFEAVKFYDPSQGQGPQQLLG